MNRFLLPQEYERKLQEEEQKLRNAVLSEHYLWDMRCWDKHKDPEEIRQWIRNGFQPNNSGHAVYCLRRLMERFSYSIEDLVGLVLQNGHRRYENRLVKCFKNPESCPRLVKCKGDYSACHPYCLSCDSRDANRSARPATHE